MPFPTVLRHGLSCSPAQAQPFRHGLYLQYAAVASMPYQDEERLQVLYAGAFVRLRLLIPDPIDLALSKLSRNTEIDRADVMCLAAATAFDLSALRERCAGPSCARCRQQGTLWGLDYTIVASTHCRREP